MPETEGNSDNPPMSAPASALAAKLRYALEKSGVSQQSIASECGITKQAITGWKRTGRVAKPHLIVLARLTGFPLEWWLDGKDPAAPNVARLAPQRPTWPFRSVAWEQYQALDRDDKADLDRRIGRIVASYDGGRSPPRKSPAGRRAGQGLLAIGAPQAVRA